MSAGWKLVWRVKGWHAVLWEVQLPKPRFTLKSPRMGAEAVDSSKEGRRANSFFHPWDAEAAPCEKTPAVPTAVTAELGALPHFSRDSPFRIVAVRILLACGDRSCYSRSTAAQSVG